MTNARKYLAIVLALALVAFVFVGCAPEKDSMDISDSAASTLAIGEPNSTESKPTEPKPTEPKPTEPKPTEPKPTEPKPTEPKPTEPKPTEPKPTEPKPTEPEPTEPKPTEPKPTEPKPTEPKPTEPKPTEPKPTEPDPTNKPVIHRIWMETPDATVRVNDTLTFFVEAEFPNEAGNLVLWFKSATNPDSIKQAVGTNWVEGNIYRLELSITDNMQPGLWNGDWYYISDKYGSYIKDSFSDVQFTIIDDQTPDPTEPKPTEPNPTEPKPEEPN